MSFANHREAALALLNSSAKLTRKAGSFLGQCVADPTSLSESQASWIATLLQRANMPPLANDGGDDASQS